MSPKGWLVVSALVAMVTIVLKTLAWWFTDSIGLLSDAMESVVNLASAMFGLLMVTLAAQPPDEEHPYGHHKAEYFSAGFEGILILVAALGIIWAALHRLWDPQPVQQIGLGLVLSIISSALNGWLAWVLFRAAREHRSIALEADAQHLVSDVWTSLGVVVGMVMVSLSGWAVAGRPGGHRGGLEHPARGGASGLASFPGLDGSGSRARRAGTNSRRAGRLCTPAGRSAHRAF